MSYEGTDTGATIVKAFIDPGLSSDNASGYGFSGAAKVGTGHIAIAWLEPIAEADFFAHVTCKYVGATGSQIPMVVWLGPQACEVRTFNDAGGAEDAAFWLTIQRISNRQIAGWIPGGEE